jgi:hypothetical protein
MANLGMTYEDLYKKISRYLGWGETPTDEHLRIVKDVVARGYRQFLYPTDSRTGKKYDWSFLRQYYTINIETGKWKYALPEDFSELITDPVYDDDDGYAALTKITPEQLLDMRVAAVETNPMVFYSIVSSPYDLEVGSKYELWLHGEPNTSYLIRMFYRIDPLKPDSTSNYLVGGIKAAEAILESCLAVAETQEDGEIGIHYRIAKGLVQDLIASDSAMENKTYLGNLLTGGADTLLRRGDLARFDLDNLYPGEQTYSE